MDRQLSPETTSTSTSSRATPTSSFTCQSRRPSRARPSFHPHSPPSPPLGSESFSLQARRLQLRNARFRGANISPRKVSDNLSSWRLFSGSSEAAPDQENQSLSPHQSADQPTGSVRRKVSILQEIHNSSQRGRHSRRPSVTALFDISFEDHDAGRASYRLSSPSDDSDTQSLRDQTLDVSLQSQISQRKQRGRTRLPSYETTRYIEHLEEQLVTAQSQLSPMQSSSARPRASKLRSLNTELRVLRQEIAEWEGKFEVRVREEVASRTEVEAKLRTKIVFLEGQLEVDAVRVKELECERDIQAQKLRNAESLRSTNRSLERRIDVLTELLAQSPTKSEAPHSPFRDAMSPTRSPGPRLSRPRSMLPSLPSRTNNPFQVLTVPDPELSPNPGSAHEFGAGLQRPADVKNTPCSADVDPDLDSTDPDMADCTASSASLSNSQRSSTISQLSPISSQWSLPFPFSPDLQGRTPGRSRNMRRFPSGTCTLKPLILPNTTGPLPEFNAQQSLPSEIGPSPSSLDALLDESIRESPEDTGGYGQRLAQEETLAALEGRISYYKTFDEVMLEQDESAYSPLSERSRTSHNSIIVPHSVMDDDDRSSLTYFSPRNSISDISPCARNEFKRSAKLEIDPLTPLATCRIKVNNSVLKDDRTPKAHSHGHRLIRTHSSRSRRIGRRVGSREDDVFANRGTVSQQLKSHFGTLAHRIIASVWTRTIRRFGALSWWVLGILLGSQHRDKWSNSRSAAQADNYEWHRLSTPSKMRETVPLPMCCCACHSIRSSPMVSLDRQSQAHSVTKGTPLGHTLFLWAKFSVALLVAVGLAFKNGPGTLLESKLVNHLVANSRRVSSLSTEPSVRDDESVDDHLAVEDFSSQPVVWTRTLTVEDFLTG